MEELTDFDFSFDFDAAPQKKTKPKKKAVVLCEKCSTEVIRAESFTRRACNIYRKAFSELTLLDILPKEFHENDVIHVISGGDIDSFSFISYILRFQPIDYLLFSTWCMASDDILMLDEWITQKKILKADAYLGEIFPGSYLKEFEQLKKVIDKVQGRVCIFRNHSKVMAGRGRDFDFVIESSANINTNPRAENTTITISRDGFIFFKEHFDKIKSFDRTYDDWIPHIL